VIGHGQRTGTVGHHDRPVAVRHAAGERGHRGDHVEQFGARHIGDAGGPLITV
jgi:hypothetical protein